MKKKIIKCARQGNVLPCEIESSPKLRKKMINAQDKVMFYS